MEWPFPPHFGVMMLALVVVFLIVMGLFFIGYRLIDRATPGDLNKELLGRDPATAAIEPHKPNVALAIVVASMISGMCFVLGCTVIGVMVH